MKLMFVDESGDHNLGKKQIDQSYPVFVLTGCIFDADDYYTTVEPRIDKLKADHFGDTDVVLRSYDIRKQKGDFSGLVDTTRRNAFLGEVSTVMGELEYTVIAAVIDKNKHVAKYAAPANPYDLCFEFLLERTVMFAERESEKVMVRIESRESHNDRILSKIHKGLRTSGSGYIRAARFKDRIVDLSFNQKDQNVAGHQMADLAAHPIGVHVVDASQPNAPYAVVDPKFYRHNGRLIGCGLKVFP